MVIVTIRCRNEVSDLQRMLFHVHKSVIEVTLSKNNTAVSYVCYQYNKGKDRFKKRYELMQAFDSMHLEITVLRRGRSDRVADPGGGHSLVCCVGFIALCFCVE